MSFSSGTTDTKEALLDLFRAFAVTSGWTVQRFAASGSGYVLNLQKTGKYGDTLFANLRSVNNEDLPGSIPLKTGVVLSMSDTYSGSADCVDQPGAPANVTNATDFYATSIHPFNAVAKYWFFSGTNPEFIAMVLLLPNSEFRHLVFGEVDKYDLTLGKGAFFFGTNGMSSSSGKVLPFETGTGLDSLQGTSWLRLVADERDGWWTPALKDSNSSSFLAHGHAYGPKFRDSLLLYNSINNFSNSSNLNPINIYAKPQVGDPFAVGHIPMLRIGRRSAFLVDQVYPLGLDEWMAFPTRTLTDDYALVYKKVV